MSAAAKVLGAPDVTVDQAHADIQDAHRNVTELRNYDLRWSNVDLQPTPPSKRTWDTLNFCTFYWGISFGNWTLGSTMVGLGLSWWESIIVIVVSQAISSAAMFWNSRCPSVYFLGFPAIARSVFGMFGSFPVVAARAILAVFWYAIQLYTGSAFIDVMLRCIFGHLWTNIPNQIPESVGITSRGMVAFLLFWLCHLPVCMFRPNQLRPLFWFKTIVLTPAVLGLFIFCIVTSKGQLGAFYGGSARGAERGWLIMQAINAGIGNTAGLITNQADMVRWSKTRNAALWSQVLINPLAVGLSATLGILATAAINNAWGLELWNPWDLMDVILDRYWTGGARALIFLSAFCWMFSTLGLNISNMIAFGSDMTLLLPQYLTIPRGQFLVEVLAWAICPWKILASASVFTTFLSGYSVFMAGIVAIMVADWTKGNVFVEHLYNPKRDNAHYYFHKGWNIQAYLAYIVGIALLLPGFCGTLGASVSRSAIHMGQLGWVLSFITSFSVYSAICALWPTCNQKLVASLGLSWEKMGS